jgi:hypothetical protein
MLNKFKFYWSGELNSVVGTLYYICKKLGFENRLSYLKVKFLAIKLFDKKNVTFIAKLLLLL